MSRDSCCFRRRRRRHLAVAHRWSAREPTRSCKKQPTVITDGENELSDAHDLSGVGRRSAIGTYRRQHKRIFIIVGTISSSFQAFAADCGRQRDRSCYKSSWRNRPASCQWLQSRTKWLPRNDHTGKPDDVGDANPAPASPPPAPGDRAVVHSRPHRAKPRWSLSRSRRSTSRRWGIRGRRPGPVLKAGVCGAVDPGPRGGCRRASYERLKTDRGRAGGMEIRRRGLVVGVTRAHHGAAGASHSRRPIRRHGRAGDDRHADRSFQRTVTVTQRWALDQRCDAL